MKDFTHNRHRNSNFDSSRDDLQTREEKKAIEFTDFNFYDINRFLPAGKILRHFSISVIYLQKKKNLHKSNSIYKKCPPFAFKHFCICSGIDSTNFMHNFSSMLLSHFSSSRSIRAVLE